MYGVIAPLGYFDPLGFLESQTYDEKKRYRESELKHGRVAMLATVGILVGESPFKPFFGGRIQGAAIYHFQEARNLVPYFWLLPLFLIALVEGLTIARGYESYEESQGRFAKLKQNYIPGDLGFDPLRLKPLNFVDFDDMRTKEINNGRLAMIGIAGMIAQECVDQKGILEHLFSK